MTEKIQRHWVALIQYPGLEQATFGTLHIDHDAKMHEVEAAMRALILEHLPPGFEIKDLIPGQIWFQPE